MERKISPSVSAVTFTLLVYQLLSNWNNLKHQLFKVIVIVKLFLPSLFYSYFLYIFFFFFFFSLFSIRPKIRRSIGWHFNWAKCSLQLTFTFHLKRASRIIMIGNFFVIVDERQAKNYSQNPILVKYTLNVAFIFLCLSLSLFLFTFAQTHIYTHRLLCLCMFFLSHSSL